MGDDFGAIYIWGMSVVVAFLVGVLVTYHFDPAKSNCEADLPRNVECVWSAPVEAEQ